MPPTLEALGIDRLSVDDRIALAVAIWDSVADAPHRPLLSDAQRRELDRRLADHAANPDDVVPWEQVKADALGAVGLVSLPVVFRRAARAEFDAEVDWYTARGSRLGTAFTRAVERVIDRAAAQPDFYAAVYGDVREALVPGFPFCVYYRVDGTQLLVLSVFHTSRDPAVWQGRA